VARVGCFLNGCCGGKPTTGWLGMRFPAGPGETVLSIQTLPFLGSVEVDLNPPQYPTQLMEPALALLGLAPALWLYFRGKVSAGVPFLVYGIWFTAVRWVLLYFRTLTYPEYVVNIIYPLIYAVLLAGGLALLIQKLSQTCVELLESGKKAPPLR
jgi:phosphatidylglycerol:prolipoprotein diacylglycerol transferase